VPIRASGRDHDDEAGRSGVAPVADEAKAIDSEATTRRRRPGFFAALVSILLAVVLMLVGAVGQLTLDDTSSIRDVTDVLGTPVIALLVAVLVAMVAIGRGAGMNRDEVMPHSAQGSPASPGSS